MTQQEPPSVQAGEIAPPNAPVQSPLHVPTLERSDNQPTFKDQEKLTWQEKLQGKHPAPAAARMAADFCSEVP